MFTKCTKAIRLAVGGGLTLLLRTVAPGFAQTPVHRPAATRLERLNRLFSLALALLLLIGAVLAPAAPARAQTMPQDGTPPDTLVSSGVTNFTVAAPKVFWYSTHDPCPPRAADAGPSSQQVNYPESISRVAVQGSNTRQLYDVDNGCSVYTVASNIVADADSLYWANSQGLVRLSVNANVGDAPQVLSADAANSSELAIDSDSIYALQVSGSSPNYISTIRKISKADGSTTPLATRNTYAGALQVSHSFSLISGAKNFVYWIESGQLLRYNLDTSALDPIAANVGVYYAEGGRFHCFQLICLNSDLVYFSSGNQVSYYNNDNGSTTPVYTSNNTSIKSLSTDDEHLFLIEDNFVPCSPQPCFGGAYTDAVTRRGRSSSGGTDVLYTGQTDNLGPGFLGSLTNTSGYLLWREKDTIQRLPVDAAALPLTNLRVTGLSITQGIQKPDNSVVLIQGRRTFVRLFVQSDGPAVSGVTARLEELDSNNQVIDSLLPVNSVGTTITVRPAPQRANLNDSFLFELPWSWINSGLRLRGVLNPYHAPPQASYANNTMTVGPFTFNPSPALKVQFIAWEFNFNNTFYAPRFVKDIIQTYSWVLRAYPLASKLVFDDSSTPGFHPNLWFNWDDALGPRVNQTDPSCQDLLVKNGDGTTTDNRNLCASRYADIQMAAMRTENGISPKRFFYGFISDGLKFPRGQACCADAVSAGPAGSGTWGWDTDGSYADWYAGHEIGHTLGRGHPAAGGYVSKDNPGCGQSRDDFSYPYSGAQIGADDNSEGFDAGDPSLGIPRAIYPGTVWHDVMSYCNNQWMSDYTYKGMYDFAIANPSLAAETQAAQVSGDFLSIAGTIITGADSTLIVRLRHLTSVASVPARVPGPYSIRLFNAANTQLADYPFTPTSDGHDNEIGALGFSQVVDFVAGARQVQIVRIADGKVLASAAISANPPVIGNVALQGAPNPVAGMVTLGWTASDSDGDPLTFDILYSRDGGASFQPVRTHVTGNSASIDSSHFGGGQGILRVIASDGVNSAQADSAPFTVAPKPPVPMILLPGDGTQIQYGQLVNFSGAAMDLQDGGVSGSNLVWTTKDGVLGTGELISSDNLPVGTNVITLTATNSEQLSASTTVTVIVGDDLNLPGPTLTAGPTQFDWQFAADATTPQAQMLHVGNAGSGSANWTASTDAAWLTVTPSADVAPQDVTLTADPASIANGSYVTGTLTLTLPATGEEVTQTLSIPVSLSKDFDYGDPRPAPPPSYPLWLPLVSD